MAKDARSGGEKKKSGFGGVLLVTLLAVAGGAGFGWYISGMLKEIEPPKKADEAHKKQGVKKEEPQPTMLVELSPIIANLAEPKSAWVRIEAALVLSRSFDGAQVLSGQVAQDITAYLKSTTLAQYEGASGFQNLREDLNERARLRGGKDVQEVVVHGMVIE